MYYLDFPTFPTSKQDSRSFPFPEQKESLILHSHPRIIGLIPAFGLGLISPKGDGTVFATHKWNPVGLCTSKLAVLLHAKSKFVTKT